MENAHNNTSSSGMGAKEFTLLVALLMSITAISIDALLPALGIIGNELGAVTANQPQLLISMLFLGLAMGQLICGPLSDALGRRPILFGGFALYLVGTIVCYRADSLEILMLGRFIQGLGVAGPYISAISLVRDLYHGAQMARIMSLVMMIFVLVPAIAPTLGQAIMLVSDWRGIFELYLAYAVLLIVWIGFRLKETLPKSNRIPFSKKGFLDGFREVVTNRITASYTICIGLFFGSFIGYLNSSQQIFQVQFNTGNLFALYFGLLALVLGFSSLINSRIVEKHGAKYIAFRAICLVVIASIAFFALHAFVAISLWMFLVYAAVLFFCFGLLFGNLNALAMEPMGHVAGIASAVIGSASSIMSMSIGTVIGQMYNNTLLPISGGFIIMGSLAVCIMYWAEKGRVEEVVEEHSAV
ncbi:Bcr/CflA family efflux MFS transporter [Marinomonas rhizomae]|uniref:Bcr/CflA family efflux transporter n=1 Tax=Marinomonas rhizomae TaxID=491948 RepID=A0A366JGC5_9GAMM|nr:multidrug effflux MFS transporter [Marinomonas rhizomae]RBP85817.1 DHA1 family bicyclomycin/chloramphenicol resistance-like MFS transporter [Marinomonas rhizomae]RNF75566.1 Bcr/CflA family efflux MFS transporter [Marinomonas rhizomae]